jgi:hypothetical protein
MKDCREHYGLAVFARGFRAGRRTRKMTELIPSDYGFLGWNPDSSHESGRLPGSGSFSWVGIVAVRKAAMDYLRRPDVFQVQVRTNCSRKLYIWNKHADGRITGYTPDPTD